MKKWLECEVTDGMFPTEFTITARQFDGSIFSLFALQEDVKAEGRPNGSPVPGRLHVMQVKDNGVLALVELPQPSLEVGSTVTVKLTQLILAP